MQLILAIAFVRAMIHFYYRKKIAGEKGIILWLTLFNVGIIFSTILFSIVGAGGYNVALQSIYNLASFSGIATIIWISYNDIPGLKMVFKKLMIVQIILSLLIIYLPVMGINGLEFINGKNYLDSEEYNYRVVTLFNVKELLRNKYYFNKTAQFHNANAVGFYGGVFAFIYICDFLKLRKNQILSSLLGIAVGILIWMHNGIRGVMIGIIAALMYGLISKKKIGEKIVYIYMLICVCMGALVLLPTVRNIMAYMVVGRNAKAVQERVDLLVAALEFLKSNFWLGNGGLLGNLVAEGIDPHQLPARIAVLFGVPMGVLTIIILYVVPIVYYIRAKRVTIYSLGLIFIIWMVSITNNYTCIVLFWLCFAEAFNEILWGQKEG